MYQISLDKFEGPMDLLLYFIRRDEIDIYDIPIAQITSEYVETIKTMKDMNISNAGEFIEMAAILVRIKAKMLIPNTIWDDEGVVEDPRTELVQRLLEYQQFKKAAAQLDILASQRSGQFPRGQSFKVDQSGDDFSALLRDVSLYDIANCFKQAMESMPVIEPYELKREKINLEDQKVLILSNLDSDGRLTMSALLKKMKTKLELIVTFLAMLELIRSQLIKVVQDTIFEEIIIISTENKA